MVDVTIQLDDPLKCLDALRQCAGKNSLADGLLWTVVHALEAALAGAPALSDVDKATPGLPSWAQYVRALRNREVGNEFDVDALGTMADLNRLAVSMWTAGYNYAQDSGDPYTQGDIDAALSGDVETLNDAQFLRDNVLATIEGMDASREAAIVWLTTNARCTREMAIRLLDLRATSDNAFNMALQGRDPDSH